MKRAALATAAVVTLSTISVPAAFAQEAKPLDVNGSVSWQIRESFMEYAHSIIAKGKFTATEGAKFDTVARTFTFPVGSDASEAADGTITLPLEGVAQVQAHPGDSGSYAMDITYSDMELVIKDNSVKLYADYVTKGEKGTSGESADAAGEDVLLSTFTLDREFKATDGKLNALAQGGTVTSDMSTSMAGQYEVGEELAPLWLNLGFGETKADKPALPEAPKGSAETPGQVAGLAAAALAVIAAIGGLIAGIVGLVTGSLKIPGVEMPKFF